MTATYRGTSSTSPDGGSSSSGPPSYVGDGLIGGAWGERQDSWITTEEVVDLALKVLRLDTTDVDADRVARSAAAALWVIDDYLDRYDDPVIAPAPEPLVEAAVQTTIRIYRTKDAPFGVTQSWSDSDFGPIRIPEDWLKGVESLISPYAHHYGVW